jgi:type I restriction enzyme R subunit
MREEMVNRNSDLMHLHGDKWVVQITSNQRDRVELLDEFQQADARVPVVAVTSQLLSTGIDVPTVRTIVLFRRIESLVEFKQIIGRGTRLAPEDGKEHFTIIDFTGATSKFGDPAFDGPPVRVVDVDPESPDVPDPLEPDPEPVTADPVPDTTDQDAGESTPATDDAGDVITDPERIDLITRRSTKHVVDGYEVHLVGEQIYVMDLDEGGLRPVRLQKWVRDRVRETGGDPVQLLEQWATVRGRKALQDLLGEALHFDVDELADRLNQPDHDPIDLLLFLSWDWPLLSRRERVAAFTVREREFLDGLPLEARQVLMTILDKYAEHGVDNLSTRALRTAPLSERGTITEIAALFGREPAALHDVIDDLGRRLFWAG